MTRTVSIADIGRVVTGKTPPTSNPAYYGNDYPFIKIPDMGRSVYIRQSAAGLSQAGADYMKKAMLPQDSVIVSCIATVGKVGITTRPSFTNQQINAIICDPTQVEPVWLYYYLSTHTSDIEALGGGGSVYTNVSKGKLENLKLDLPSLPEQQAVIEQLLPFDEKLELLQQTNQTYEQLAYALFDQLIIQNPEASSWQTRTLGEFFDVKTGKKDANYATEDGAYPFFTCSQIVSSAPDHSFDGAAILVAGNGDFNIKFYRGKFEAYQRTYVLIPHEPKLLGLLYFLMKINLARITGGSRGSVIKFITKGMIEDFKFVLPNDQQLLEIGEVFEQISQNIEQNVEQKLTIDLLRNDLLGQTFTYRKQGSLA